MKLPANETWIHKIRVKPQGLAFVILLLIISVFLAFVAFICMESEVTEMKYIGFGVCSIIFAALLFLLVQYLSFRLYAGEKGFYLRTNPFNGRYYCYSEITSCRIDTQKINSDDVRKPTDYNFFFVFTDKDNKKREFQFIPAHQREIVDYIVERIEKFSAKH